MRSAHAQACKRRCLTSSHSLTLETVRIRHLTILMTLSTPRVSAGAYLCTDINTASSMGWICCSTRSPCSSCLIILYRSNTHKSGFVLPPPLPAFTPVPGLPGPVCVCDCHLHTYSIFAAYPTGGSTAAFPQAPLPAYSSGHPPPPQAYSSTTNITVRTPTTHIHTDVSQCVYTNSMEYSTCMYTQYGVAQYMYVHTVCMYIVWK